MSQRAGWYDDPEDEQNLRYWDGVQWSSHTSPKRMPGLDQAGQAGTHHEAGPADQPAQVWGGQGPTVGEQQAAWGGQEQGRWSAPMPGADDRWQQPQHRDTTPDGQPLAGWGLRLLARIVDGILLSLVTGFVILPLVDPTLLEDYTTWIMTADPSSAFEIPEGLASGLLRVSMVSLVVGLAYEVLMLRLLGATVGKLLTGLRVRLRETPGQLPWAAAAVRGLVWQGPSAINGLGQVFMLLNGLWPLWDAKRQALHDKAARTNVVRNR
ncbi:RDD family protein [Ornithinimicrobium sp. W1665]|uniref:RDD family protein n=1 Tax=Ornithinimicrobium sp. W1665 TaxID=3416666 RepID=UPI003CF11F66